MRVKQIKLYKFDELSDEAKEKAINDHREFIASDTSWQSENVRTLEQFENIFPIKVKEWEYGNHNFTHFISVSYSRYHYSRICPRSCRRQTR